MKLPKEELDKQFKFIQYVKEVNNEKLMKTSKTSEYCINTFGCQMNESDSEVLSGMLEEMGFIEGANPHECDIILFNTCCVRENAEEKVYGHLGALKNVKKQNENLVIAICGCMMQQESVVKCIREKYKHVDIIFGTHNAYMFPEMLYNKFNNGINTYNIQEDYGKITEGLPASRKDTIKAWVTIMYGCNNFCSYCIVPYVRGREKSRNLNDIVDEVAKLCDDGYKEITLLGQNVNSYGNDLEKRTDFADVLYNLNKIAGLDRIRFMTSHPKDLSDELINAVKECNKVCKYLHLPLQSGSTKVLADMNRKYTKEDYLRLIEKMRNEVPNIAITTDIIVGFPGETDEDFEDTLDVIRKVRFDSAYTFLYSKRTGTLAATREEQISDDIKKQRFSKLLSIQNSISKEINQKLFGTTLEVLVEGKSKSNGLNYTGRADSNKIVNFNGDETMIGKIVKVKIDKVQTWSLGGKV